MRKFSLALLLLLIFIFVFARTAELEAIGRTLQNGDWRYLLLALLLEVVWLFNVAISYWLIYRSIGLNEKIDTLFLASSGAYFANVIAPTAGASGLAVFITTARRRGYSTARATIAGALYILFDYLGFIFILALGLIVLFRRNNLNIPELVASAVLFLIAGLWLFLLFLGMRSGKALGNTLAWFARQINRLVAPFIRREYFSEARARAFAYEASTGLKELRQKPGDLMLPAILAVTNKALLILILLLMFKAFQVPLSIGTLIASFSIGYLFLIVSPTPAGIGMVEGALTLALSSMYVPLGVAAVVALAYRAITFWVPLAFGGLALRLLDHQTA
ncbi:MAG TPA: lysylphosphatidylglycerol synthase transmembrane domain-containing protein [Anaerolineales bacterium]|nr:lysylphosphatidylglycerol synthase transmembrane domain-containing protein [Anaerolineales bacterium]